MLEKSAKNQYYAPVAQLVEHLTFNQGVRSSILRRSTKKERKPLAVFLSFFRSCQNDCVREAREFEALRPVLPSKTTLIKSSLKAIGRKFSAGASLSIREKAPCGFSLFFRSCQNDCVREAREFEALRPVLPRKTTLIKSSRKAIGRKFSAGASLFQRKPFALHAAF